MNEESQVRDCCNITFICTNQETVSVLEKTQANKTFRACNITFICTNQETVSVLEKTQANKTFRA